MNKRLLKRESNIRDDEKNSLSSRKVQTITNTNMVTNGRIRNKLVTVTKSCDQQIEKTVIFDYNQQTSVENTNDEALVPIKIVENLRKAIKNEKTAKKILENMRNLKIKMDYVKANKFTNRHFEVQKTSMNLNLLEVINFIRADMEKMSNNIEHLNKLKTITVKLSNEKNNNNVLMNSVKVTTNRYQNHELKLKTPDRFAYKDKLDEKSKELENVLAEKEDLLKRLKNSDIIITDSNVKIKSVIEEYKILKRASEKQCYKFNDYIKDLENKIGKYKNKLAHKELYIENLESNYSKQSKNYENQIRKLSANVKDMKSQFLITEMSYNKKMMDMRNKLQEKEKLIVTKSEVIKQQNKTLNLMKEIMP